MEEVLEKSMQEKCWDAYILAEELCFTDPEFIKARDTNVIFDDSVSDVLWGYVDGLEQNRHYRLQNGICSLQATIDYDLEKEEKRIDEHIKLFLKLKSSLT